MQKESSSSVRFFYPRFDKEELIKKINKSLKEIAKELPIVLVTLFGSYARGNYTVASDVDILIILRDKEKEKKNTFAKLKKHLDIPSVELHIYSEDEYRKHKESIDRLTAGGIVLFSENK